jgi:hypothetical protein
MAELQVSKLDAARRQVETAIRLYFAEADPVSIHKPYGFRPDEQAMVEHMRALRAA